MESKQESQGEYIGSLIQDGFYDKLVIIGFPYDEGAKKNGARCGSDYGPDSFRRFVKEIGVIENSEYEINISKGLPKISDYGNIQINYEPPVLPPTLQALQEKLSIKVGLCIQRGNIPFVIGGSRDLFGSVSDALLSQKNKQNCFISINHSLDVKLLLDQGIPHQSSNKRYLLSKMDSNSNKLIEFGLSGQKVTQSDLDYFKEKNPHGQIIWLRDIRLGKQLAQYQIKDKQQDFKALTQAGQYFEKLVDSLIHSQDVDQIYISINLENIEGAIGVSSNCTNGGIKSEEIIEICYLIGLLNTKLVALDINEYNPFVEDWRTGRLVASMFYYFTLGLSQRLQQGLI